MSNMTWLELYNFLHEQANSLDNIGEFDWSKPVTIHDAETGDEYTCDTFYVSDDTDFERTVLMINIPSIFN